MFGILIVEPAPAQSFKQRLRLCFCGGYTVVSKEKTGKATFIVCRVCPSKRAGGGAIEALVKKGLEQLKAGGAFRIAADKKWHSIILAQKLAPVRAESTMKACAYRLVLSALQTLGLEPKATSLLLYSSRAGREVQKLAMKMGGKVKYIHVSSQCASSFINKILMQELGIAESAAGQTFNAAVVFDNGCFTDHNIPAINLTGEPLPRGNTIDFALTAPSDVMEAMPPEIDATIFCAALYLCGGIAAKDISFKVISKSTLDIMTDTQYNKG